MEESGSGSNCRIRKVCALQQVWRNGKIKETHLNAAHLAPRIRHSQQGSGLVDMVLTLGFKPCKASNHEFANEEVTTGVQTRGRAKLFNLSLSYYI